MLVARVDSVCMQHGQSKQFAHLQQSTDHQERVDGVNHSGNFSAPDNFQVVMLLYHCGKDGRSQSVPLTFLFYT